MDARSIVVSRNMHIHVGLPCLPVGWFSSSPSVLHRTRRKLPKGNLRAQTSRSDKTSHSPKVTRSRPWLRYGANGHRHGYPMCGSPLRFLRTMGTGGMTNRRPLGPGPDSYRVDLTGNFAKFFNPKGNRADRGFQGADFR